MLKLIALLFTAGKFSKLLLTGGTMLLSVFAYALVYGWRYAVGFVLLIFVHEMGHYVAARRRGLQVGAPTFIPFVGAWIQLKDLPHDAETEAYVGMPVRSSARWARSPATTPAAPPAARCSSRCRTRASS